MKIIEVILIMLEIIAGRFGFGLVSIEDAKAMAESPIPYEVGE